MRYLILLGFILSLIPVSFSQEAPYRLTILHTNDTHAHHEATEEGIGGVAKQATLVKQIRTEVENSLLLDGGDRFTGSLFHTFYLGQDNAQIMNALGYDAMVLGSYEFAHGAATLAEFVTALDFPVLASNVSAIGVDELTTTIQPYVVLEIGGEQVGLLGVTRADARVRPVPEISFSDDYLGVTQATVDELTGQGVNKIILLSHLGYFDDLALATQVSGVDVIVGADTATFLSNTLPDAEGPYPTDTFSATGEPVLVVQTADFNEYLGRLDVEFDAAGVLVGWSGDALPLDAAVEPDADMTALVDELREPLGDFLSQTVGSTETYLEGNRDVCRYEECNLGNVIADALRDATGVQVAFHNGGGIRASVEAGDITNAEIQDVLPFNNTYVSFDVTGADLVAALENSVSRVTDTEGTGRFLQVSGLRFTFDASREAGRRVVSVEIQDENGQYAVIDPFAVYSVATNDFIYAGGDDYIMFANAANVQDFGLTLDEALRRYIEANSPINPQVEGRIVRADR